MRAARADVDLGAIAHNTRLLTDLASPAELCAVVKADGYGHGAIAVSQAALAAGATWLGVALVEEGAVLRKAGVEAPILLLSQPRPTDLAAAVRYDLRVTLYSKDGLEAAAAAARRNKRVAQVHLKVDTGMHRVGAHPEDVVALATLIEAEPALELEALWTHYAVADEPGHRFTDEQFDTFQTIVAELRDRGMRPPLLHVANSAATIDHPRSRLSLARAGIALYGIAPSAALEGRVDLRPAMSLRSEVSFVKAVPAGASVSYGLRHEFTQDSVVATVPIGYADGVPRGLSGSDACVLIRGRRCPIVGTVTMDQILVDCGPASGTDERFDVAVGDEVVLIGEQGDERVSASDWSDVLGTIPYEIICGIGPRVPRFYRE